MPGPSPDMLLAVFVVMFACHQLLRLLPLIYSQTSSTLSQLPS